MIDLSISIVTYQARDYVIAFIDSIIANTHNIQYEILLADNGDDGTADHVRAYYPEIVVTHNRPGIYFGPAANQNFEKSRGRYLCQFTPDTLVIGPALENMVKFLDDNPKVGVVNGRIIFPDGRIQDSMGRDLGSLFAVLWLCGFHDQYPENACLKAVWGPRCYDPEKLSYGDMLYGAWMVIRKEIFHGGPLIDPLIRLGWMEYDVCKSVRKAGYLVAYNPDGTVIHHRGHSISKDTNSPVKAIDDAGLIRYARRSYGWWAEIACRAALRMRPLPRPLGRVINKILKCKRIRFCRR